MKKIVLTFVASLLLLCPVLTYAGSAYIPNWQSSTPNDMFFGLCISNITDAPQTVTYILYDASGNIAHQESNTIGAHNTWSINIWDQSLKLGYGTITGTSALVAVGYIRSMSTAPGMLSIPINEGKPF